MDTKQIVLFDAKNANGASVAKFVQDYETLLLQLNAVGFTGTIKFVGSYQESIPDFGSASSLTNAWETIKTIDVQDGGGINGNTGIAYTTATTTRMLEVNTSRLVWFGAIISGYSVGAMTAKVLGVYKR